MDAGFDIGFLGGGQLARMSIQAAQRMGLTCISLDPGEDTPAAQIAPSVTGALNDPEALLDLARNCAFLTLENEFVPAAAIRAALQEASREENILTPGLDTLATIQDKLLQRQAYAAKGVASPKAVAIEDDGTGAIAKIGFPMVLKARTGGYDGRGTRTAKSAEDFEDLRRTWSDGGWLAEEFVPFKRELAVMVMRWVSPTYDPLNPPKGSPELRVDVATFPTMESVQANHMCDLVFPADVDASAIAVQAVEAVGGFGLFGVELFEREDGSFVVNEIAPRPHNSGHYTLDWGGPSQFEQHVRLTIGLPPLPIDGFPTCMANLIGQRNVGNFRRGLAAALAQDPGVQFHWYGKAVSRPGRKMGHMNVVGEHGRARAEAARARFYEGWKVLLEEEDSEPES
ncbi:MAG: ATP-grasp domain-containing protein [Fimbriimonadaceae bacterium]|nr:ATP-grasp domain-containing protein [Fimbriimonadaceae bacterium]